MAGFNFCFGSLYGAPCGNETYSMINNADMVTPEMAAIAAFNEQADTQLSDIQQNPNRILIYVFVSVLVIGLLAALYLVFKKPSS